MPLVPPPRAAGSLLVALLALGACGQPAEAPSVQGPAPSAATPSSAPSTPPSTPSPAGPASGTSTESPEVLAFCAELDANGATGTSLGPILLTDRKQRLLADVGAKLKAMGDATPPAAIAKPWRLQKRTMQRVQAAAKKLDAKESLATASPPLDLKKFQGGAIDRAQTTLTDYWFEHCR